jgi:hypothetical protein
MMDQLQARFHLWPRSWETRVRTGVR